MGDLANWIIVPVSMTGISALGIMLSTLERDHDAGFKMFVICATTLVISTIVCVLWTLFLPTN